VINLYFDIVIAQFRRVSFKIEFDVVPTKDKLSFKEVNGNKHFADGPVFIEKDSDNLHFYWSFNQAPKCYFSEKIEADRFQEPLERNWFRCQNFLFTNGIELFQKSQILDSTCLRFTVRQD
jgi:hypothetical protein